MKCGPKYFMNINNVVVYSIILRHGITGAIRFTPYKFRIIRVNNKIVIMITVEYIFTSVSILQSGLNRIIVNISKFCIRKMRCPIRIDYTI